MGDDIELLVSQSGIEWIALSSSLGIGTGWEPSPEAAFVALVSKARQKFRELRSMSVERLADEERDVYLVLSRWFG